MIDNDHTFFTTNHHERARGKCVLHMLWGGAFSTVGYLSRHLSAFPDCLAQHQTEQQLRNGQQSSQNADDNLMKSFGIFPNTEESHSPSGDDDTDLPFHSDDGEPFHTDDGEHVPSYGPTEYTPLQGDRGTVDVAAATTESQDPSSVLDEEQAVYMFGSWGDAGTTTGPTVDTGDESEADVALDDEEMV